MNPEPARSRSPRGIARPNAAGESGRAPFPCEDPMKKSRALPQLPPLGERVAVDRLGDVLLIRPAEGGVITLARADLRALDRVLADPTAGKR